MNFQPPQVDIGQSVLFRKSPNENEPWMPAYVVQVGGRCHTVHVFIKANAKGGVTLERTRCLHVDDPDWSDPQKKSSLANDPSAGCWTKTPRDIVIDQMLDDHFPARKEERRRQLRAAEAAKTPEPEPKQEAKPSRKKEPVEAGITLSSI